MNVLVVGFGSIGRRHVRNLFSSPDVGRVTVWTGRGADGEYAGNPKVQFLGTNGQLADLLNEQPFTFGIVANETYRHMGTALLLARHGLNLFIEKPLSHSMENVQALEEVVEARGVKVFIGYNMRYLGALKLLRDYLSKLLVGKPYFARIEVGQYLPSWRSGRDYRESYSARREWGGGVAGDLSHEIDYMRFLFGDPCQWTNVKSKTSDLCIDSDDVFEGIYRYDSGFVCSAHMDYLRIEKKREISVIGSEGSIVCDLVSGQIRIITRQRGIEVVRNEELFDLEKTYRDEMADFIGAIRNDREPAIGLRDGIQVLRLIGEGHV